MQWDTNLFFYLNSYAGRSVSVDAGIVFIASWLPYILIAIFVLYLASKKSISKKEKVVAIVTAGVAALIARIGVGSPIRFFFPRPRPFLTYQVHQLIPEHAPSFPSGHALFFFAFSTVVYFYNKKLGVLLLVLSACVCIARVAAGIHYPSDITAGAGIGILCGILTIQHLRPLIRGVVRRTYGIS